jgi:hypothetical protein
MTDPVVNTDGGIFQELSPVRPGRTTTVVGGREDLSIGAGAKGTVVVAEARSPASGEDREWANRHRPGRSRSIWVRNCQSCHEIHLACERSSPICSSWSVVQQCNIRCSAMICRNPWTACALMTRATWFGFAEQP